MRVNIILLVIFFGYTYCGIPYDDNSNGKPSIVDKVSSKTPSEAPLGDNESRFRRINDDFTIFERAHSYPGARKQSGNNPLDIPQSRSQSQQFSRNVVVFDTNACITAYEFISEMKAMDNKKTYPELWKSLDDSQIDAVSANM